MLCKEIIGQIENEYPKSQSEQDRLNFIKLALIKQIPMDPMPYHLAYSTQYFCTMCGGNLGDIKKVPLTLRGESITSYCKKCGQLIDWEKILTKTR